MKFLIKRFLVKFIILLSLFFIIDKGVKMNKKGINNLMENVVYILLVVVFVSIMIFSVSRVGSNSTLYEQIYSKQIAFLIDKAEPGMEIEMDIYELYSIARKNRFTGQVINIDNKENKVIVRLVKGKGYEYNYFNDVDVVWDLNDDDKKLILGFENE